MNSTPLFWVSEPLAGGRGRSERKTLGAAPHPRIRQSLTGPDKGSTPAKSHESGQPTDAVGTVGPAPVTGPPPVRSALVLLSLGQGLPGVWALLAPRSFYDGFPLPGHGWLATFPPYNEHLVRDLGALSLALTAVLALAAVSLERHLVQAAAFGCLAFTVPHLVFHVAHLGRFGTADVVGQLISQVAPIAVSGMVLLRSRRIGVLEKRN